MTLYGILNTGDPSGRHLIQINPTSLAERETMGNTDIDSSGKPGTKRAPRDNLVERLLSRDRTRDKKVLIHVNVLESFAKQQSVQQVSVMILPQVHLRKPCYDFYFL